MLLLTKDNDFAPGIRRRTLSARVEIGALTLTFVVITLALVVSLIYLAHANRVATRGYVLKKLELEKNELVTEQEIWQQKVSEAKSLGAIKSSSVVENMRRVRESIYVRTNMEVAKR